MILDRENHVAAALAVAGTGNMQANSLAMAVGRPAAPGTGGGGGE